MVLTGYYMRYFILAALFITVIRSYFKVKRTFFPVNRSHIINCTLIGAVCIFQFWRIYSSFTSSFHIPQSIELEFPLKNGEYYILHGGNNETINHHYEVSAQKYALDIVKLNRFGLRSDSLIANDLENYYIFGDTLYSPSDGIVVDLIDSQKDLEPNCMDSENPAGNYLAIQIDKSNMVVILAHLMEGSCLVKKGDFIKKGQPIARVGNSGNTSEPHLHMHVVVNETGDFLFTGQGVPMKFKNKFLVRNDIIIH